MSTPVRTRIALTTVVLSAALAACTRSDDADEMRRALDARQQLERRLTHLETREASLDELEHTVEQLERRLAAVEGRATSTRPEASTEPSASALAAPSSPPAQASRSGAPNPWGSLKGAGGAERRAALAALTADFQKEIARIQEQYGHNPASTEGRQALQEANESYRERVRALLSPDDTARPAGQ